MNSNKMISIVIEIGLEKMFYLETDMSMRSNMGLHFLVYDYNNGSLSLPSLMVIYQVVKSIDTSKSKKSDIKTDVGNINVVHI